MFDAEKRKLVNVYIGRRQTFFACIARIAIAGYWQRRSVAVGLVGCFGWSQSALWQDRWTD